MVVVWVVLLFGLFFIIMVFGVCEELFDEFELGIVGLVLVEGIVFGELVI